MANRFSDDVSVLINRGDGTFADHVTFDAGHEAFSVALGDVDGDGAIDLVVANGVSNDLSILINDGSGTFARALTYAPAGWPHCVAIGDLDASGDVGFDDLLVMLSFWGPCAPDCAADLDGSGDVGFDDLLAVLSFWGPCS